MIASVLMGDLPERSNGIVLGNSVRLATAVYLDSHAGSNPAVSCGHRYDSSAWWVHARQPS